MSGTSCQSIYALTEAYITRKVGTKLAALKIEHKSILMTLEGTQMVQKL